MQQPSIAIHSTALIPHFAFMLNIISFCLDIADIFAYININNDYY